MFSFIELNFKVLEIRKINNKFETKVVRLC
jgi:hypothetical protein